MISKSEIALKSRAWGIPPNTVDKDYVLGHFLSVFSQYYDDKLLFKGGTCLRKCYYSDYRFSEDLDFSSKEPDFKLREKDLENICDKLAEKIDMLFYPENITALVSKDISKGYQVKIQYWGANHSKHVQPTSPGNWTSKIKLEISTQELCVFQSEQREIIHLYSDELVGSRYLQCYSIDEIVCEKLRSLVQRSYSAPRDIYDLYHLTKDFSSLDWERIIPAFKLKMQHKDIEFIGASQLISEERIPVFIKAWDASIAHQIDSDQISKEEIIRSVYNIIHQNILV
ncbi:MAG: nucleotidyl transferase AbiEii/AbiGii toxin family protein [Candidatus Neomarinimicrobiota bacterium]